MCGISQIASAVYTINGVPANVPAIVFQGKRSRSAKQVLPFETIVLSSLVQLSNMDMVDPNESESVARFYSDFDGDFEQTISLFEMNVDEVEIEVQQSFEEVCSRNYCCYHMLSINLILTSSLG